MLQALSLLLGLLAVAAALRVRRPLAARLGPGWQKRFWLVQGGVINVFVVALVFTVCSQNGLANGPHAWLLVPAYLVLYFFYSLSNIHWTAKKFHPEVEA